MEGGSLPWAGSGYGIRTNPRGTRDSSADRRPIATRPVREGGSICCWQHTTLALTLGGPGFCDMPTAVEEGGARRTLCGMVHHTPRCMDHSPVDTCRPSCAYASLQRNHHVVPGKMTNLTLYTTTAGECVECMIAQIECVYACVVLLLDSDGNRLLAKYYQPPHAPSPAGQHPPAHGNVPPQLSAHNPFPTYKDQRTFEKAIWDKTRRASGAYTELFMVAH